MLSCTCGGVRCGGIGEWEGAMARNFMKGTKITNDIKVQNGGTMVSRGGMVVEGHIRNRGVVVWFNPA